MKNLIQKIKNFFNHQAVYQTELDRYVSKFSPTTPSEVEHLIRQFDRKYLGRLL